jgi:hypothetical protein
MLGRALRLATVMLLIDCFAAIPVQAQNLEAGKSPSQIFAGTCSACHKSPRGLLKTVPAGSLPGFLRQHYTTSSDMASLLSAFLISNGATDTRYVGTQPKQDKDAKPEAKPAGPAEQLDRYGRRLRPPVPPQDIPKPETQPQQAERPDDGDELAPQAEPRRQGRNAKRLARPSEAPDTVRPAVEGRTPAHAAGERGPDGRKSAAKHRLSKRNKPGGEELPKTDAGKADAARDEPPKREPVQDDRSQNDTTRSEGKSEGAKALGEGPNGPGEGKSEAARIEAAKQTGNGETPALRPDPVSPVTPAPQASPAAPTAASSAAPEPPGGSLGPSAASPPPAVTASVPHPAPVAPPGPPVPPISQ